ncbi:hypothetical protein PHMEG_00015807 [Phytophthora megakarya]|uniref:Uncharacterized protein n=1 Tax=Phytophthora megakarya TaxID=4795 RepID=A0A225W0C7_9STRA|nr:hypothetical protein PHMEG_00015807 [Phytophthora megakarya]
MFWRRSRPKEEVEETDDLVKLQKQFGITPVNDADVQAEFQALLAATGGAGGVSPTVESLLFGAGDDEEDEEAKILRDLQLDGLDDEGDGHQEAKNELREVLDEVHATARQNHRREAAEMSGKTPAPEAKEEKKAAQAHALKLEALALKREGKIQEALAKFREAKQLQEQNSTQRSVDDTSGVTSPVRQEKQRVRAPVDTILDDEDVEMLRSIIMSCSS